MGFDNECILNIQSLHGEYFCPVCRTLVYPHEAFQSQCTHLYCKPCLNYVVATTQACPYDGYLVSEADAKPLMESNKSLADMIGKVMVHCLFHRSGCQWQGTLSECIVHCTTCTYGNSPVVCNRCSIQIVHRQVQEHAQICPGLQPHAQQADTAQAQPPATAQAALQGQTTTASQAPNTAAAPAAATVPTSTIASTAVVTGNAATTAAQTAVASAPGDAAAVSGQVQGQNNAAAVQVQTAEQQWYQQYQQYYQQYPGYNPYVQYQQYGQYQQYQQPQPGAAVAHQAPQVQMQQSAYVQRPSAPTPQGQPVVQPLQPQMQPIHTPVQQQQQPHQLQLQGPHQAQAQGQAQAHTHHIPGPQMQIPGQQFPQPAAQPLLPQPGQHALPPQQLQLMSQPQVAGQHQMQLHPGTHPQVQQQQQMQLQNHSQLQSGLVRQPQSSAALAVTGHQSYPQMQPTQVQSAVPQQQSLSLHPQQQVVPYQQLQQPIQMGNQLMQHPHMRPSQGQYPSQHQSAMMVSQGAQPNPQLPPQQHLVGHHMTQQPGIHPTQTHVYPNTNTPLQQGQQHQQAALPSQQQGYPQQPLHLQGPHVQQHVHAAPYTQHGSMLGHGAPVHQAQVGGRGVNQHLPQSVGGPANQSQLPADHLGTQNPIEHSVLASFPPGSQLPKPSGGELSSEVERKEGNGATTVGFKDQAAQKDSTKSCEVDGKDLHPENADVPNDSSGMEKATELHGSKAMQGFRDSDGADMKSSDKSAIQAAEDMQAKNIVSTHDPHGQGSHVAQGNVHGGQIAAQGSYNQSSSVSDAAQRPHGPPSNVLQSGQSKDRRYMETNSYLLQGPQADVLLPHQLRPLIDNNIPHPPNFMEPLRHSIGQTLLPMQHPGVMRPHREEMMRPHFGGPAPGVFEARGPFASEQSGGLRPPGHPLESRIRNSVSFDGKQGELPFVQSTGAKTNGDFLRSANLDGEGPMKWPLGRPHEHYGSEGVPRLFERPDAFPDLTSGRPSYIHQSGRSFPLGGPVSEHPTDFGERHGPFAFRDGFGMKSFSAAANSEHPGLDFGRYHKDVMMPFGSPSRSFLPSRFGAEDFDSRDPRGFVERTKSFTTQDGFSGAFPWRKGFEGLGETLAHRGAISSMWRSEPFGRPGEQGSGSKVGGHGFLNDPGHFGPVPFRGEFVDRGLSWCRICKVDCDSVERLAMHVQTNEHMSRSKEMVAIWLQDGAKKQKMSFEASKIADNKNMSKKPNIGYMSKKPRN